MRFMGCDHGTTELRFALDSGSTFSLTREQAASISKSVLLSSVLSGLGIGVDEIGLVALSYSMGDGIDEITPISRVMNRGVVSQSGAGDHVGGGTRWYDAVKSSGIPAVVVPGLHRGNYGDARFNVFSHGASGEKVGLCFGLLANGYRNFLVGDVSANTVSLAVRDGILLGAIDAPIFAPGTRQGPLDVELIRRVDDGEYTADGAFSSAGPVNRRTFTSTGDADASIALFAAMELAGLGLLVPDAEIFLAGSLGSNTPFIKEVSGLLGRKVESLDVFAAARGMAALAVEMNSGANNIMGLRVIQ